MTIWFSTNIPEMRAISTFKRVSTDISDIQERITSGQRINSGKDDPGGLILREGLRAEIKSIHATQANMTQAEILMDTAAGGIMGLLELLRGSDTNDPTSGGLLGELYGSLKDADATGAALKAVAEDFMKLYDATVASTTYNGQKLIGGDLAGTTKQKTYQLGGGQTLDVAIADLSSGTAGAAKDLADKIGLIDATPASVSNAIEEAEKLVGVLSAASGALGGSQKVAAMNQKLLESRLTNVASAEGRISNADIAVESSRMARAELLAQNAMSSIMYTRSYAAFSVSSLFG